MSVDAGAAQPGAAPPLPSSIWMVAWASLAGQAALLAWQGVRLDDEVSLVLCVVLGALLVGYVSAGVVRACTVRLAFAWVVLVLSSIVELVGLISVDGLGQAAVVALSLATTALALAGLARFRRTEWYAWQRTKPSVHEGAPTGQLVAMGVLVRVLGGLIGSVDDGSTHASASPPLSESYVRRSACPDVPQAEPTTATSDGAGSRSRRSARDPSAVTGRLPSGSATSLPSQSGAAEEERRT